MTSPFSFAGKTVVITGAFSGMGRAAAEYLVADGATVHALDIRPVDIPGLASFRRLDLGDRAAIDRVAGEVTEALEGPLDILLNCAGLPHSSFPAEQIFQVNYLGPRRLTEALVPVMPRGGAVANIASKSGIDWPSLRPVIEELLSLDDDAATAWFAEHTELHANAYGFSKACVIVYAMTQATPLGSRGLRVNCIAPGATDTPMMEHFRKGRTEEQLTRATGVVGRMSTPAEQALPLLFLASDAASYVSGVNLVVDAGALAGFMFGQLTPPDVKQYQDVRNSEAVASR